RNRAAASGALFVGNAGTGSANVKLANVTVIGDATDVGGLSIGTAAEPGPVSLDIVNSTIFEPGNAPGALGSIGAGAVVTVTNSAVATSMSSACSATSGGTIVNGGHTLATDATCSFGTGDGIDPKLDPAGLADHDGLTQTIALLDDSPARDAGDD